MQHIRRFEEERKVWENERSEYLERERLLTDEKWQAEQELAKLNGEVERLRTAQDETASARQGPREPSAPMRTHVESQLNLMKMIDGLRSELLAEQSRARSLEQKASEAEKTTRRLSQQLELGSTAFMDLDASCRSMNARSLSAKGFMDLDCSVRSLAYRQPTGKASSGSAASSEERDELSETIRTLQTSRKEVISLEDETLRLREDLNYEKQKVIELKRAAHQRAAAWKEELQKITEELNAKQRLEQEVAQLRAEHVRCRKELSLVHDRELVARKEVTKLQKELEGFHATKKDAHKEMELLSSVVGGQLVAVEQELTQQMKKSSQLFEHFLRRAHEPLAVLRRSCRRIAASGAAGKGPLTRPVPPHFEADVHDLQGSLAKIVDLLRYSAEVVEGKEHQQSLEPQPPMHKRDPVIKEESSFAAGWMRPFVA